MFVEKLFRKTIFSYLTYSGRKHMNELLANTKNAMEINEALLMKIIRDNENTEYGKLHNFKNIHSIEDYKKNVPLSNYSDYRDYAGRMFHNNETNLITSYPVKHFSFSSGTTQTMKIIPYTKNSIKVNTKYCSLDSIVANLHENNPSKNLSLPLLCTITSTTSYLENGISYGCLSEEMMAERRNILKRLWYCPMDIVFTKDYINQLYLQARYALETPDIAYCLCSFSSQPLILMSYIKEYYPMLIKNIETGQIDDSIALSPEMKQALLPTLKPNPQRAALLREEFSKGLEGICSRIWPSFYSISMIGNSGFKIYTDELRYYLGDKVKVHHYGYLSSEGVFAMCHNFEDERAILIPDSCFFEFLPLGETDQTKTLNLDQLTPGEEYELIITNLSGFYRYQMKDIIKVDDYYEKCPRIHFVRRGSQWLNLIGEKVSEHDISTTYEQVCHELNILVTNYVVTPILVEKKYHFFFELNTQDESKIQDFKEKFVVQLQINCPFFASVIATTELNIPEVFVLPRGSIESLSAEKALKNRNQFKQLHIIEDSKHLQPLYDILNSITPKTTI